MKKRADSLLVDKKITDSYAKAQAMIMAGQISINGKKVLKSGELYETNADVVKANLHPQWVSRGASKLLYAFENFIIDVKDLICLDIGASTGGFTEVLLSKKAKKIYAVDVGANQLHEKLRKHTKVINIPKTNARYLSKNIICDTINVVVCDVSFISMKKVIEPCLQFLEKKKWNSDRVN